MKAVEINLAKVAKVAYEGYCEETEWKSLATGQDLPQWKNLPLKIQAAWVASVREALCQIDCENASLEFVFK